MIQISPDKILYFIIVTVITGIIADYFLKYKLFKWLYFGTLTVIVISLLKQGNDKEAAAEIFKLARI
jgi:hypothetical protein